MGIVSNPDSKHTLYYTLHAIIWKLEGLLNHGYGPYFVEILRGHIFLIIFSLGYKNNQILSLQSPIQPI